jgi:5-methylcytosine-specific restriction endonuclease McrA
MRRRVCIGCGAITQGGGRCDGCRAQAPHPVQRSLWPDPRATHRWKTLAKKLCAEAEYCAICCEPLDHQAPGRSRWAPSADHITPLARGGDAYDLENLRVTHYGCNASRGAAMSTR